MASQILAQTLLNFAAMLNFLGRVFEFCTIAMACAIILVNFYCIYSCIYIVTLLSFMKYPAEKLLSVWYCCCCCCCCVCIHSIVKFSYFWKLVSLKFIWHLYNYRQSKLWLQFSSQYCLWVKECHTQLLIPSRYSGKNASCVETWNV